MSRLHLSLRLVTKMCIFGISNGIFYTVLIIDPLRHHLSPPVTLTLYILSFALIGAVLGSFGCVPWCYANRGSQLASEDFIDSWPGRALNAALGVVLYSILGFLLCVLLDMAVTVFDLDNFLPHYAMDTIEAAMISLCAVWGGGTKVVQHRSLYKFRMRLRQQMQRRSWRPNASKQRRM